MEKIAILTALILLGTSWLWAQTSTEAKTILDKTYQQFEASNGVLLQYEAVTKNTKGKVVDSQKGSARVKDNKFQLDMTSMDVWFDGKTQWVHLRDLNEVNISNPTEQEVAAISPLALLTMYRSGFKLAAPVKKTIKGKAVQSIKLTPTAKSSPYKHIVVAVNDKAFTIHQVQLTMSNGTVTTIDVTAYKEKQNFTDATFTFDKSKFSKAEIIDLR